MDAKNPARRIALLTSLLMVCGAAQAQLGTTWTLASDYDFRGTSNSATDPVLQASLDYETPKGFWIGAWASNFDYGPGYDGDLELDLYAGYTHELSETRSWSAGLTAYTFPDSHGSIENGPIGVQSSFEGYVDVTLDGFHAAQWYTPDYAKLGASALYTEANYLWTLPRAFSLRAHAGIAWGDYWDREDLGAGTLGDFALALSCAVGQFTLAGTITGTDASGARRVTHGAFTNQARFVLSVETTFPWDRTSPGN